MIRALLLLAAILLPAAARADAAVDRFMAATGRPALAMAQVDSMRPIIFVMLRDAGVPSDKRAEVTERLVMPELRRAVPDLLAQWAAVYAADLSPDDMQAVEAFFATPAGQHMLASQVQISNSLALVTLNWRTAALRDAIDKHRAELPQQ